MNGHKLTPHRWKQGCKQNTHKNGGDVGIHDCEEEWSSTWVTTSLFHVGTCCSTTFLSSWKWCVHESYFTCILTAHSVFLKLYFLAKVDILTDPKSKCVLNHQPLHKCVLDHTNLNGNYTICCWEIEQHTEGCRMQHQLHPDVYKPVYLVLTPSPTLQYSSFPT